MIKTEKYTHIDKMALRQKGWKLFAVVMILQIIFLTLNYMIST